MPEGRQCFAELTVAENLTLGAYLVPDRAEIAQRQEAVLARFPRLRERLGQFAGSLSGGEQQMLAIGRALMGGPDLLLLDEPSMGLAPLFVEEIFSIIASLRAEGTTILLVEQNASAAWTSRTTPMCWRPGGSCFPARPRRSPPTRPSPPPIWAAKRALVSRAPLDYLRGLSLSERRRGTWVTGSQSSVPPVRSVARSSRPCTSAASR